MYDFIFIAGSPGTGKTTISKLLQKKLDSPLIDFGNLRVFHLDREWTNANEKEEQMSFENLTFILKNYAKHGYENVIVNDLRDFRILQLEEIFKDNKYIVLSLFVNTDEELKKRVLDSTRDSGFRNHEESLKWNKNLQQRELQANEFRIDNSHNNPEQTVQEIMELLAK